MKHTLLESILAKWVDKHNKRTKAIKGLTNTFKS